MTQPDDPDPDTTTPGNLNLSTPENVELTVNEIRAMQLRMAGLTYQDIARQLGWQTRAAAYKAVGRALEKWGWQTADDYRKIELARLDAITQRLWPQVLGHPGRAAGVDEDGRPTEEQPPIPPDKDAVALFLRVSERRARLLGLDAPEQVHLVAGQRGDVTKLRDLATFTQFVQNEYGGDPDGIIEGEVMEDE